MSKLYNSSCFNWGLTLGNKSDSRMSFQASCLETSFPWTNSFSTTFHLLVRPATLLTSFTAAVAC